MLALLWVLAGEARAEVLVIRTSDVDDDCCAQEVVAALETLAFVGEAGMSPEQDVACATLEPEAAGIGAEGVDAQVRAAMAGTEFAVLEIQRAPGCPVGTAPRVDPWAGVPERRAGVVGGEGAAGGAGAGIDVAIVSRGEVFELGAARAAEKYTVFDFGAPWCGPCVGAAERLKAELAARGDLAVRAVILEGDTPQESFAQPVVAQHMAWAQGVPWFIVVDPAGRVRYQGSDLDAALKKAGGKGKKGGAGR